MKKYNNIENYFQEKGIKYKPLSQGKQLYINCPFCQSEKLKCTVQNSTGLYYCFLCGAKGNWKGLIEKLGDPNAILPEQNIELEKEEYDLPPIDSEIIEENSKRLLESASPIMEWLYKRGLIADTIKKFKLGWDGKNIT